MNKNFLEIKDVTFAASKIDKVHNVSFNIEKEGDIICLLGPSGIGKTTILRSIAGLTRIQSGKILLKNKILSSDKVHIEPEDRNISLSFQDNCLFPHYSIIKNIQFGAERNKKSKKSKKNISVDEIINFLNLENIKDKFPHQVSAGEAQRAALARSLITNPDLLLLDEPLSNVDQSFKEEIQVKLKKLLTDSKITTIIVTHDSYEAFYLGSKCGIILNGQLRQFDSPYNVYHYPNSIEVVNFLNRGILIPAKVTGEDSLENEDLGLIKGNFVKTYPKGADVQLLLQPEDLHHDDHSNLKLEVVDRKFRGTNFIYSLRTPSNKIVPVFVHSHHIHQHEMKEKFGIKKPIYIDHIVCF
ncbi:ABC transporter ATP-binding protein [Candidatus Pelagibacter sp.]|jgi:iron(III) transport system ATP-binding protein|nr:ABC transporter ATP-binding protein [Candidatus Pelagibacter sp.]|tara:strand:+ start:1055 stop:2122 length:1068 start_codon:yes stop_codon:yes gene_type:complete